MEVVKNDGATLHYVFRFFSGNNVLEHINGKKQTFELTKEAIKNNPIALRFIKDEEQYQKYMCDSIVKNWNGWLIIRFIYKFIYHVNLIYIG